MKKHSGSISYVGIMVALFGLMLMGAAYAANFLLTSPSSAPPSGVFGSMVDTANLVSLILLVFGSIFLAFGIYLRTMTI